MRKLASADAASGLLFSAFGVLGIFLSLEERIGTSARMGPGYLPLVLSSLLALLGFFILLRGLFTPAESVGISGIRPLAMVLLSIAAFAACIRTLGFGPATFSAVAIACYAEKGRSLPRVFLLALAVSIFCSLTFVWGLGLSIPMFSWPWKF